MRGLKNRFNYVIFAIIMIFLPYLPSVFADIIINEIMQNPAAVSDANGEWFELYNNGTINVNLIDWQIKDNGSDSHTINKNLIIPANGYIVLCRNNDTATNGGVNCSYEYNKSTLGNSDDEIILINNSLEIDRVYYDDGSDFPDPIGKSMELKNYSLDNNIGANWGEAITTYGDGDYGTPGYENSINQGINQTLPQETKNIVLETYLDEIIYINAKYTKLFKIKIKNKDGCSEKDAITVSYTITNPGLIKQDEFTKEVGCSGYASTGEFTPIMPGDYTLCGTVINSTINETDLSDNSACKNFEVIDTSSIPCNITLNITTVKETYSEGESIKFHNNLNNKTFPFTIEYWIEDFFSNIYKNKYNTTNTNQKSWKTSITEQDRVLFIKSIVYPNCNDSNTSDNSAEKMFIVLANDSIEISEESSLEIIGVDDKAKFGDIVDVKVEIYKGKTSKYSISLWVEDKGEKISETTKIHLYDKYSSYNGQLPIQLDPNCNQEFDDGKYDVVIKGLDQEDKKEIKIEGIKSSACQTTSSTKTSSSATSKTSSSKKFEYEIIEVPEKIISNKIKTKVQLSNNDDNDYDIKIWSYLYRGSKCYSGEREANKKEILLQAGTSEIINMENSIIEAALGDYKYKVVINKDNQKTNKEIIKDIAIEAKQAVKKEQLVVTGKAADKDPEETQDKITSNTPYKLKLQSKTVYESVDEKIKKLTFAFLITLSIFLNIALVWRR